VQATFSGEELQLKPDEEKKKKNRGHCYDLITFSLVEFAKMAIVTKKRCLCI
jgi:hypothetical protein